MNDVNRHVPADEPAGDVPGDRASVAKHGRLERAESRRVVDRDPRDTRGAGDQGAIKRYLAFLSAGGSKYPVDLLKDAGVDMTTDEPLNLTIQRMNQVMDEMEKLLK